MYYVFEMKTLTWSLTVFWARSHSGCLEVKCLRAQTAGSVISSRSPAAIIVLTRASMPPTWQTTTLFFWLLQVKLERIPAAQVTMFTSFDPSSCKSQTYGHLGRNNIAGLVTNPILVYSVDFSQSRINVKKCVFNKHTIKVCVSCC